MNAQDLRELAAFRADLHAHPELSGSESRTAQRLAERLTAYGCEVATGIGGHGVVGRLRNGEGPTLLLRAELDALPVKEDTGLSYASTTTAALPDGRRTPVAHACGHDIHLACLAGAAKLLAEERHGWRGEVLFVGQPAEETLTGAAAMLADGLYDRYGTPDAALAQHVSPFPAGLIAHPTNPPTAAGAELRIVIGGEGGHTGSPHLTGDPVRAATSLLQRLPDLVVGALHAGERANVVPDLAVLEAMVRAPTHEGVDRAIERIRRAAGANTEVTIVARVPPGRNDPALAELVRSAHPGAMTVPGGPACEDFPLYGVPSVYWYVGSAPRGARRHAQPHSPGFAPDPVPTIRAGVAAMHAAARAILAKSDEMLRAPVTMDAEQ
jgi:amidohydrolase